MDEDLERLLTEIRTAVPAIAESTLLDHHDVSEEALHRQLRYLQQKGKIRKREGEHDTYWEATD